MRLFTATVFCTTCQRKIRGDPMSNEEDADLFMRSDHMKKCGHFPDGVSSFIHLLDEVEQPEVKGKTPPLVDKIPIRNLDEKPRSLRSNLVKNGQ